MHPIYNGIGDSKAMNKNTDLLPFVDRIKQMNLAFRPITCYNTQLTNLGKERVEQFKAIVNKELDELDEVFPIDHPDEPSFEALADCLGDVVVYVFSEAARWGIPLIPILHAIMASQESKLVDGKPIPHPTEAGKFGKGPNYKPPDEAIERILNIAMMTDISSTPDGMSMSSDNMLSTKDELPDKWK